MTSRHAAWSVNLMVRKSNSNRGNAAPCRPTWSFRWTSISWLRHRGHLSLHRPRSRCETIEATRGPCFASTTGPALSTDLRPGIAIRLSAGDRIEAIWRYDNSEANPRNPVIPPEEVELGARVGVANVLLMCAPAESLRGRELAEFAVAEMRRRQR